MMRDPQGNLNRYEEYLRNLDFADKELQAGFENLGPKARIMQLSRQVFDDQRYVIHLYAAGTALSQVAKAAALRVPRLMRNVEYIRDHGEGSQREFYGIEGSARFSFGFTALALLLVPDLELVRRFHEFVSPLKPHQNQLLDLLVKAFDPNQRIAKKYQSNRFTKPWCDPVLHALALPDGPLAGALAVHLKNWPRLMGPFGWRPYLNTAPGKDALFCDFAFEVALAVCGWDIDDSSFADHPYYPADLVRYYREHVRHSRDAWRPEGAGAGVEIVAPPLPAKSDLAKSKRKGIARWVELVSDGDQDATDAVLESIGKPRKIKDLEALVQALGEAGIAIHADVKDDDTVAQQTDALSGARGLGQFDGSSQPAAGPARCVALLRSWEGWLAARNYRLIAIDALDDAWHAIVVRNDFYSELQVLSTELTIPLSEPSAVFED